MTHPPATARFRARHALRIAALVVVALPTLAASGRATTITYAGSLLDLGAGWRTDTVSKGKFGLNGSNVLGNDGYQLFGTNLAAVVPGYLTMSVKTTNYNAAAVGNGSYYSVDNPTTTPGREPVENRNRRIEPASWIRRVCHHADVHHQGNRPGGDPGGPDGGQCGQDRGQLHGNSTDGHGHDRQSHRVPDRRKLQRPDSGLGLLRHHGRRCQ